MPLALCALSATFAQAGLILFSGNPNGYMPALHDEGIHHDNVMFNKPGLTLEGNTVEGFVNGSTERVTISSPTILTAGGGQAPGVEAETGDFFDAIFAPHTENAGTLFRSLSFNIDSNGNDAGNVAVRFYDAGGLEIGDPFEFEVSSGNNFFGAIGDDEMVFSSVVLTSDIALDRIAQIRTTLAGSLIQPPTDPPSDPPDPPTGPPGAVAHTPEPPSVIAWLVVALVTFFYGQRRRSR